MINQEQEQEQSLLAMVIEWGHLFARVDWLQVVDFNYVEHRDVWNIVKVLADAGEKINQISVYEAFRKINHDPSTENFISVLFHDTLISQGISIELLAQAIRKRRIEREMKGGASIEMVLTLMREMDCPGADRLRRVSLVDALHSVMDEIESGNDGRRLSGYPRLDYQLGGMRPTDLIVISGRPSMGKTSFALNIAYNIAKQNLKTLYFNLEMSCNALAAKIFASEALVNGVAMRDRNLREFDIKRLMEAGERICRENHPLVIYDAGRTGVEAIRETIKAEKDVALVVVDQLTKVIPGMKRERKDLEIAEITFGLKAMAKEFNIPVILLHQTNREVEKRSNQMPTLADLRDSGAVEQDADIVMFVHRESYYNPDKAHDPTMVVRVAKNKMGETGDVYFNFERQYSKISELEKGVENEKINVGRIPAVQGGASREKPFSGGIRGGDKEVVRGEPAVDPFIEELEKAKQEVLNW